MFQWINMEAGKSGFNIVIERPDSGFNRRQTFMRMRCERSGKYKAHIRKLKCDDTRTKYKCPFEVAWVPQSE